MTYLVGSANQFNETRREFTEQDKVIRLRLDLLEHGYEPIAVNGKAPKMDGWQLGSITPERIAHDAIKYPHNRNTGLRTDRMPTIDIDLWNDDHTARIGELVVDRLGPSPLFRRGRKGLAIPYRMNDGEAIKSIIIKEPAGKDPETGRFKYRTLVEILCRSRQVVAYGDHPETGNPYQWIGDTEPLLLPYHELPLVTPQQLRDLAEDIRTALAELGYDPSVKGGEEAGNIEASGKDDDADEITEKFLTRLPPHRSRSAGGWFNFNCVACNDTERKAGFRVLRNGGWEYHCFHAKCEFEDTTGWQPGRKIGERERRLYSLLGGNPDDLEAKPYAYTGWIDEPDDVMREALSRHSEWTNTEKPATQAAPTVCGNARAAGEPLDIFGTLTPEPTLTPDMLPEMIADFAVDTADRLGVTLATVAMPALAVCAGALHGAITIQPKRADTEYREVPILWTEGIGDPGMRKSPALRAAVKPLEAIETEWKTEDDERLRKYERDLAIYKEQVKIWDRACAQGKRPEGNEPVEPVEPPQRQLITTDYTLESIGPILEQNPRGILLKIDELSFFYGSFDAYRSGKASKDRPAALELWDGGRRNIDRASYKLRVPNWGAGIVGNIQEDKLASLAKYLTDDGLMQRFLVYRVGRTGVGEDRAPDHLALERYECLISYLARLEPTGIPITLSEGAHAYREEIERITDALSSNPVVNPALRSHAAKLHGLYARLLLVMHVIDNHKASGYLFREADFHVVTAETAKRTRDLMVHFLIPNAVRVYTDFFSQHDERGADARWIAGHILAHKLARITDRDIYRAAGHNPLKDDESRRTRAMTVLVDAGWATVNTVNRAGSRQWSINPKVHVRFAARGEQEARQRRETKQKIANSDEILRQTYNCE